MGFMRKSRAGETAVLSARIYGEKTAGDRGSVAEVGRKD